MKTEADAPKLIRQRAVPKRKITIALASIAEEDTDSAFLSAEEIIIPAIKEIKKLDLQILEALSSDPEAFELSDRALDELDSATKYHLDISSKLNEYRKKFSEKTEVVKSPAISNDQLKLPNLKCSSFSGEDSDSLKFHDFITQFRNVVDFRSNLAASSKLTYLKGYLTGYALKVVSHLKTDNENYPVALELLEREFLNKDQLVDDLFSRLVALKPISDCDSHHTKLYINEVRCALSDLKNYGKDLLADTSCEQFVSHIVFSKLPTAFRQEAARKLGTNFPTLSMIFENYVEILRMLSLRTENVHVKLCEKESNSDKYKNKKYRNVSNSNVNSVNVVPVRSCKFCSNSDHAMVNCRKYRSHTERVSRCKELKLCSRCTSARHDEKSCNSNLPFACPICSKTNHIHALCRQYNPKPEKFKPTPAPRPAIVDQNVSSVSEINASTTKKTAHLARFCFPL